MKTCFRFFLATAFLLGLSNAYAQVTDTAQATITIVQAITVTQQVGEDLRFDQANPGAALQTVAATDATRSAKFDITAEPSTAMTFSVQETAIGLDTAGGGGNCSGTAPASSNQTCLRVDTFTTDPATGASTSAGGALTVAIGATRTALADPTDSGSYSATFTLDVSY